MRCGDCSGCDSVFGGPVRESGIKFELIRDGGAGGQAAECVDYDTIRGEQKTSNEICVSKADGTLLLMRDRGRTFEYSK